MTAFLDCQYIESQGAEIVFRFLESKAYQGRIIPLSGHELAKELQAFGDVIVQIDKDKISLVEIKIEQRFTGNFFIETWSNKQGLNRGWIEKIRADRILYLFLDKPQTIFSIKTQWLKAWLFKTEKGRPIHYAFTEKRQAQHNQMNDTWGWLIPIEAALRVGVATEITLSQACKNETA